MTDKPASNSGEGGESLMGLPPSSFSSSFGLAHLLGMQLIQAQDGIGLVSIQVDERLMHSGQVVHGGVIFTLADTAM